MQLGTTQCQLSFSDRSRTDFLRHLEEDSRQTGDDSGADLFDVDPEDFPCFGEYDPQEDLVHLF